LPCVVVRAADDESQAGARPDPPDIPALVPGERIARAIVDYLRSGLHAGMDLPDATDSCLTTIRGTAVPWRSVELTHGRSG
jgi:lysine decarboxylase